MCNEMLKNAIGLLVFFHKSIIAYNGVSHTD